MNNDIFDKRIVELNGKAINNNGHCVVYWMQRSQRTFDNLALKFAIDHANSLSKPLLVYFGLYDQYPMASVRAFKFLIEGLKELVNAFNDSNIGFVVRRGFPPDGVVEIAHEYDACSVVVDEDYLNIGRDWRSQAASALDVKLYQVDTETVVPVRNSGKEEWGAYTLRPKLTRELDKHFIEIPESKINHKWHSSIENCIDLKSTDALALASSLDVDQSVVPTPYFIGGFDEANKRMRLFIEQNLPRYKEERNEIGVSVSSDMSPYFHFGQISSLRAALMVEKADAPGECIDAFLEQLIVRRELGMNFCLYNSSYDKLDAASDWAHATLDAHRYDERAEILSLEEIESANTYDDLWNASQNELIKFGKIHPYLRMVWAKKLLEWSPTPEEALSRAIYLNDKYALDGRDPNGYTNIAWSIYGKHDRPFAERPIFGKIRYMNTDSTKRKTHWQDYIDRVNLL